MLWRITFPLKQSELDVALADIEKSDALGNYLPS